MTAMSQILSRLPNDRRGWRLFVSVVINVFLAVLLLVFVLIWALKSAGEQTASEAGSPVWIGVLFLFGISGAVGGVLAALQLTSLPDLIKSSDNHWNKNRTINIAIALLISGLGGVGGAGSALFVMLLDGKIKDNTLTDTNKLTYVSTGLIAGFLGFSLLKKIAEAFARAIQVKEEARDEAKKVVEVETQKLDARIKADELSNAVAQGLSAWYSRKPKSRFFEEALNRLVDARKEAPDHRSAAIVLANLYQLKGDLPKSVETVTDTLRAMKERKTENDDDVAALLYNRTCYLAGLLEQTHDPAERTQLEQRVYDDLARSFELDPKNAEEAEHDPDLEGVAKSPKVAELFRKLGIKRNGQNIGTT
jgi:hypothetical protein